MTASWTAWKWPRRGRQNDRWAQESRHLRVSRRIVWQGRRNGRGSGSRAGKAARARPWFSRPRPTQAGRDSGDSKTKARARARARAQKTRQTLARRVGADRCSCLAVHAGGRREMVLVGQARPANDDRADDQRQARVQVEMDGQDWRDLAKILGVRSRGLAGANQAIAPQKWLSEYRQYVVK